MEQETKIKKDYLLPASILISAIIFAGAWVYNTGLKSEKNQIIQSEEHQQSLTGSVISSLEENVLPSQGVALPVAWGNLGAEMVKAGVIDKDKFENLYASRGGSTEEMKKLLLGENNENLKITPENSGMILNLFWALGLGAKNDILEKGPMNDPQYGDAGNFASTGGWTLSKGDAMNHYSRHSFINLTEDQQKLVERVAKGIYRPCCGNSTYFPDCNHGMAMLGFLELMASQGVSEAEMYRVALQVNSYWFPDTYLVLAQYFASKGMAWDKVNPQEVLGINYSSGSGYQRILKESSATPSSGGGSGCGVEGPQPVVKPKSSGGCGI